jgi:hypothetical protein
MATMIGLVGDQPLPNFLAVRHFHYDKVLLVYTKESERQYEYLKAALQKEAFVNVAKGIKTEAFYINQIVQTLDEELTYGRLYASEELVFNLTGGTKAMSLAAFQVAQLHDAEMLYVTSGIGKDVHVYHSSWSGNQLLPAGEEEIPACIELKDVFDLHLGKDNWEECGPSRDIGGLFEKVLADALRKQKNVISEVKSGIRTLNRQIQMDIVVRLGNHYAIIEAKTKQKEQDPNKTQKGPPLKGVEQLSIFTSLLSTYSRGFYVTTVPANSEHKALMKALDLRAFSLESYDETKQTISEKDEIKLLTEIENAFLEPPGVSHVYS